MGIKLPDSTVLWEGKLRSYTANDFGGVMMGELSKPLSDSQRELKKSFKESRRTIILPSEIEDNFKDIIHQATVDLKHKLASGTATDKDLNSLIKLIEGHCKLESLDLKRQELQASEVTEEEVDRILKKLEAANVQTQESN